MTVSKIIRAQRKFYESIKRIDNSSDSFSSKFGRRICSKSESSSSPSSDVVEVTDKFISVFTKQPFSSDNPQLINLVPKLTNKVVESVLNNFRSWKVAHLFFTWSSNQHGYKHTIYTYNAMASILSRARQIAPLRVLAHDVVDSRCFMSPGALGFLIRCLGNVGLGQEANMLFDQVKIEGLCVPNRYTYNCLLEAICKSGSADLVEMRLKEMCDHGWGYDKYTLTPVLQVYCNAGKFDKALRVFNEIYDRGWVDEHVFYILLVSFSKWGEVDKACELIKRIEDCNIRLNEKTFCVLIHGFVKESRMDKALQLFDKMKKSGFFPDVSIYDVMIGGLCVNKQFEAAFQLYYEMKESGKKPDMGILSKLISSCSDEGELTQLLKESWEDMDAKSMTLLCNSIMSIHVNNGSINKAYNLLQAMIRGETITDVGVGVLSSFKGKVSPNTTSFSIVINKLLKDGKLDLALSLFRDMNQIGCKQNVVLYNNLIDGLCNSNRLEESYELLREMEELGFEPTHFTLNSIFGCLCGRQDVVGALNLVRKMRVHGHEPWIKNTTLLIKELCKHGKAVESCRFLSDMIQEGYLPDIVSYSAAVGGLIDIQKVDLALELFRDICAHGCCPDVVAYNIIINGLCKAQRVAEARDLFNEMIMKGLVPSVATYNSMINGWCKSGDVNRGMLCLSQMYEKEREANVITYTTLIDGLCGAGKPDDALMLWNEMEGKGCAPNRIAFMALIQGLCKCGRAKQALVHLRLMKEREMKPDIFVYVALINAFCYELNSPLAFEILKEMVDEGNFPHPLDKNYSVIQDAILKLSEDSQTSSHVKNLIVEGSIPAIILSDSGSQSGSISSE
ncbi:Pentatricopeptide repeat-containing protein [Melia azedarach]|uniref:Pentatricopeptide repeat-containing protein n=1 Tax=Melia azedarach TaxID=155640 RepID=A0ACC1XGG6_MELAZ|nr:Pentatricopeptide repeat-containing protein [Melia azedarach]